VAALAWYLQSVLTQLLRLGSGRGWAEEEANAAEIGRVLLGRALMDGCIGAASTGEL
jgi:hypothetical protein